MHQSKPIFLPILTNGDGNVRAKFMLSVIQAFANHPLTVIELGDSHPGRGRNRAVAEFLRSDSEYLLFIDADIIFSREDIETLMASTEPVLCGVYPIKKPGIHLCAVAFEEGLDVQTNADRAAPVRRAGTGFMRIHRSVFERLREFDERPPLDAPADLFPVRRYTNHGEIQHDYFQSGVVEGEWLSEDWFFCDRVRAVGFNVMLHLGIQCHHEGTAVYPLPETTGPAVVRSWRDIQGWFDYEDLYKAIAKQLKPLGTFVEVGSWMGKSIAAMAEFTGKAPDVEIVVVDTFAGSPSEEVHRRIVAEHGGSVRGMFDANMKALGLSDFVRVMQMPSVEAAQGFHEGSIDVVFIDAEHTEGAVLADIRAWLPKVARGGIIAGHDYDYPEVKAAVDASFPNHGVETMGRCWYVRLP